MVEKPRLKEETVPEFIYMKGEHGTEIGQVEWLKCSTAQDECQKEEQTQVGLRHVFV